MVMPSAGAPASCRRFARILRASEPMAPAEMPGEPQAGCLRSSHAPAL